MPTLQTSRLILSHCRPADVVDFIQIEHDPEVMRFLNGGHVVDRGQTGLSALFLLPTGTEPYVWTARHRADGCFVGWFCLWPETPSLAELGYRLRRSDWGKGLATEGASALVDWGFRSSGHDMIMASTIAVNHASRRVLEKIGLSYARTVQLDWPAPCPGTEDGEVVYEVTRSGWNGGAGNR